MEHHFHPQPARELPVSTLTMQHPEETVQNETCKAILSAWVTSAFSRPRIDPDWLRECFHWIFTEQEDLQRLNANNTMDPSFAKIWQQIVAQFLESNLNDSTIRGSGFGKQVSRHETGILQGPPLLVQVIAVTEIIRPDHYPAVRLMLSDGEHIINAVVHPSLVASRQIDFDSIKLGYKMLLDSPRLRKGVLYLSSNNVALMGGGCTDLDQKQIVRRAKK